MLAASANCGQNPQWHYTQCGSAALVMFTACHWEGWGSLCTSGMSLGGPGQCMYFWHVIWRAGAVYTYVLLACHLESWVPLGL